MQNTETSLTKILEFWKTNFDLSYSTVHKFWILFRSYFNQNGQSTSKVVSNEKGIDNIGNTLTKTPFSSNNNKFLNFGTQT